MIIPCIDLMDGRVVQLRQGKEKALETTLAEAIAMFKGFPLLHIIDLDAAKGVGNNSDLVREAIQHFRTRVGGGVRTVETARELIHAGADQVIIGSAAFTKSGIDREFLKSLAEEIGADRIIIAIDSLGGKVAVNGWQSVLPMTPADVIEELEEFCAGFLCTNVDDEGLLQGTNLPLFASLREKTKKTLIAAGGITTIAEVTALLELNIEAALGMSIYKGHLQLPELRKLIVEKSDQ